MADIVIRGVDPKIIDLSVFAKFEVIVLPEGHGRLVDAKQAMDKAGKVNWISFTSTELGLFLGSECDTIVPMEPKTEEDKPEFECTWEQKLYQRMQMMIDMKTMDLIGKVKQAEKLLPVRPGNVVFETDGVRVYQHTVKRIVFDCGTLAFDSDAIANGNVFLTEREAEQAAGLFREGVEAPGNG